ncbi:hypothetical protein HMPREF0043_00543 [Actinobaculum sp. oral taxon 183 str. F0552]|nr:hypothetical protein HMPREF0043_00543 [Actinobaculum sp. oral taxon 183 str. F0552]
MVHGFPLGWRECSWALWSARWAAAGRRKGRRPDRLRRPGRYLILALP